MNKPFIIAEMSSNHLGDFERAKAIVHAAAEAEASAVKLQTWTPGTMCIDDTVVECGTWKGRKLADLYEEAFTPWEWHEPIFDLCQQLGMIGFSTPFDINAADFLEGIGCPIYKIASFELVDIPLIKHVAGFGKPMIMSMGMAKSCEILRAFNSAYGHGCNDITLLKCTSDYPAKASDANLASLELLKEDYGYKINVGISDHTQGIGVAIAAIALGATVIEKHLTLSHADGGLDASFSMELHEFAQLVTECNRAAQAIGEAKFGCSKSESTELRRSLYIIKDAKAGDKITLENVSTARPAKGLEPCKLNEILGKRFAKDAKRGMPLVESLIDS